MFQQSKVAFRPAALCIPDGQVYDLLALAERARHAGGYAKARHLVDLVYDAFDAAQAGRREAA